MLYKGRKLLYASLALALIGCTVRRPVLHAPDQVPKPAQADVLKVHLRSGDLVVLQLWTEGDAGLTGTGTRYGIDRTPRGTGAFIIPRDSIALLETAAHSFSRAGPGITLMGVWTVLWTAVTVVCVSDPKACFGSCPTFYVDGGSGDIPAAEGFSSSIARVLEARDIDALYGARADGPRFAIRMTNEALETHAVRTLRLITVPRAPGGRVFRGIDGRFYPAPGVVPAVRCGDAAGDCLAAIRRFDKLERRSLADSTDLAIRETMELEFPPTDGPTGIVLAARQSFVSTYLFYQTMAYLGSRAGDWLATLERSDPREAREAMGMARALGGIEVSVANHAGEWESLGTYDEAGPIATDVAVLPLGPHPQGPVRIRLRMAQGAWRVNWVGLAPLGSPLAPVTLDPDLVERNEVADTAALRKLRDPDGYLVTYPGDSYRITFALPEGLHDPELFLESQGYYYEWMRREWLAEENPTMAALLLLDPQRALRRLAPGFKHVEPKMERLFWASRFGR